VFGGDSVGEVMQAVTVFMHLMKPRINRRLIATDVQCSLLIPIELLASDNVSMLHCFHPKITEEHAHIPSHIYSACQNHNSGKKKSSSNRFVGLLRKRDSRRGLTQGKYSTVL
jgi:hypothetical protein